jgi:UDP-GlcNAc:undecaprenyl-phosphate/decaprenyl-phosphate GlcNAc-1-phosphate transferase
MFGTLMHLSDILELHDLMVLCGSFVISLVLLGLGQWIPMIFGGASRLAAVQAVHLKPTPRVGGVAIFLSLVVGVMLQSGDAVPTLGQFFAATSILFLAGLLEDVGFSVSPRMRLLASALASLLVIFAIGMSLDRVDFEPADQLLAIGAVSILFTVLMTSGGANAFNLVDGLNGLASFTAVIAALGLASISLNAGAHNLAHWCLMLSASVGGFLALNFPFGRIFLGDAGAYTIGFILVWVGVALVQLSPEVSPWAILLTLFWPLSETLFTILRRLKSKRSTLRPDRMHFHHVVLRALEICVLGRRRRHVANPLATTLMLPFLVTPAVVGVSFWNDSASAFGLVLAFCALYRVTYLALVRAARHFRRRLSRGPNAAHQKDLTGPSQVHVG